MNRMTIVLIAATSAFVAAANPAWKDNFKIGDNTLLAEASGAKVRVDVLADNLFRVRMAKDGVWTESGLNR